jgi:hypothetical protein
MAQHIRFAISQAFIHQIPTVYQIQICL